ncbi:hypothetical protein Tco_0931943 [Tanacetum coccineum]
MTSDDNTSGLVPQRQMALEYNSSCLAPQLQLTSVHNSRELRFQDHRNEPSSSKLVPNVVPTADETYTSLQDVSNSFVISDNLQHQDTQPTLNVQPTSEPIIPPTYVNAEEINTDQAENAEFKAYEFINPFALPGTEAVESSSRNIDTSNMHTFYQRHRSDYHWTKNHLLEQIRGNPSKLV